MWIDNLAKIAIVLDFIAALLLVFALGAGLTGIVSMLALVAFGETCTTF